MQFATVNYTEGKVKVLLWKQMCVVLEVIFTFVARIHRPCHCHVLCVSKITYYRGQFHVNRKTLLKLFENHNHFKPHGSI